LRDVLSGNLKSSENLKLFFSSCERQRIFNLSLIKCEKIFKIKISHQISTQNNPLDRPHKGNIRIVLNWHKRTLSIANKALPLSTADGEELILRMLNGFSN
jgi:hypothetical protein